MQSLLNLSFSNGVFRNIQATFSNSLFFFLDRIVIRMNIKKVVTGVIYKILTIMWRNKYYFIFKFN